MKTLYETLGVKKIDSKDKIKKAYRKKSMKAHPDQGGSSEEFDSINKAYRVLMNEESRAKYDGGEDPESILKGTQTEEQKSMQILAQMFVNIVMASDPITTNIVKQIKSQLENAIAEVEKVIKMEEAKKQKFTISLKRFKTSKKENFFESIANAQISNLDKNINQGKEAKEDLGKALKFLDDYSYVVMSAVNIPVGSFFMGTTF
jgi:curved DNA-binding protein CbpA